jgi:hypothetical protein
MHGDRQNRRSGSTPVHGAQATRLLPAPQRIALGAEPQAKRPKRRPYGEGLKRYERFTHVAKTRNTLGQLERIIEDVLRTYVPHWNIPAPPQGRAIAYAA